MPKNDQQIYTCQPCCRCWSGQSINVDELAENKGCIDVCSGNIITPESWLDCEIMYGDGAANGRWGDRWWRVGGVAASVLIGGGEAKTASVASYLMCYERSESQKVTYRQPILLIASFIAASALEGGM